MFFYAFPLIYARNSQVYKANGTTVAASIQKERNYGKYYTINVSITNTGDKVFTFDPSTTAAYAMKKGREITMEPGEVLNGYMNVKYDKVQSMDYVITVNDIPYTFTLSE